MRHYTTHDVDELESRLRAELPGFRIAYKDESRFQRAIAAFVRPFNRRYLSDYTTVLGRTVWMPSRDWRTRQSPYALIALLRHEAVHLRDMRRFPLIFPITYALLLPAGLTMRAVWEARAYRESMKVEVEATGAVATATLDALVRRFAGPEYLFMWAAPRAVRRHFERVAAEVLAEVEQEGRD
ncbi:MAG: hypothetical protein IV100_15675 [Myxococcales bacterium]|nr:hypothetical protein [Myxococcales bacterium]